MIVAKNNGEFHCSSFQLLKGGQGAPGTAEALRMRCRKATIKPTVYRLYR